ncbi:RAD26-like SNF2 family DNA-dependent ATPase [Mycena maculata]|uniref:RAD26-like SNF2 family DNA-dependent ATPase n=1 Tax=Mycena maculata TaxID=230809 RepID=A0AAD7NW85_9AGAR|nr:RAD26-like SNF2 family DNA-dependent ATPase [Mycena maculata]
MPAADKVKASVYTKRNSNSIAAPIEESDSDSDFNAGPLPVKEEVKKVRRKSAKRQAESMDSDDVEKPSKKKRKSKEPVRRARRPKSSDHDNPLLQYFVNMDLHSDSSEGEMDIDDGPSYFEPVDDESEADEGPAPVNTFAQYARPQIPVPSSTNDAPTEDSDDEPPVAEKSKIPPRKYLKPKTGSDTEESDSPPVSIAGRKLAPPSVPLKPTSGTDTESDSDVPVRRPPPVPYKPSGKEPRPGFPIPAGQEPTGPLVLDADQGIQVPEAINTYLREYQRDGIRFFWKRYNEGRGGLLGDDMGMGKTIQVISFLSAIMKKEGVKSDKDRRRKHVSKLQDGREWRKNKTLPPANATWPTCLIIAPTTVVRNWERELELWGYFEVGSYVGNPEERAPVLEDFKKGRLDIVLTSLDLARRDIALLDNLAWSCVFVDEVHNVKNPNSKTSLAYNEFECIRRFGLTGTAIQNSYDELWTILDWTSPGRLGDRSQWRGFVSKPLKLGQSASATEAQQLQKDKVSDILHTKLLPDFFLRRTKAIIADQLPRKTDEVVFCPLASVQIRVYKKILAMDDVQAVLNRDEPCECGSNKRQSACCIKFDPATIFKVMSVLIKLSNHLGLILPSPKDTKDQLVRNRELAATAFPDGDAPTFQVAIMQTKYCGKWAVLLSLLKDWSKDKTNKVLIFTKTVKLLEMMAFHLKTGKQGYGYLQLDGSVPQGDRMPMIDQFHRDPNIFIFLISTMAGGTGLNLTGANKVVIFDPSWNPAHDLQAMDRAFRFGQTRDVSVVRLLGAGSIEELIYARQVYKQQQMKIGYEASVQTRYFEGVQGEKGKQGELFGLNNMFKLHEGGLATKAAIEKAHLAELDWALASMDAAPAPKSRRKSDINVTDLEAKCKEKEYSDFKGLGALLFDDAPPQLVPKTGLPKGEAMRGMYTHQNADLLVASKIEQERAKDIAEKTKRKKKKSVTAKEESPAEPWPPIRKHKKKGRGSTGPQTAEEKLHGRLHALVGTGMITNPAGYAAFAHAFTREYTAEEQAYTLQVLDEYREYDSDSDGGDADVEMEIEPEDIEK